jgi:hypothetical protein
MAPPAAHHQKETPSGVDILGELLEVLSQLVDTLRQYGNLNLNRSGVIARNLKRFDDFLLLFLA